jgi:hypothetical protein
MSSEPLLRLNFAYHTVLGQDAAVFAGSDFISFSAKTYVSAGDETL